MPKLQKVLSSLLALSTSFTLSGLGLVAQVQGAQLTNASVSLSDSRPSVSSSHTITFKVATTGNIGSLEVQYANTASGTGVPSGLTTNANTTIPVFTNPADDSANWTRTNPSNGKIRYARSGATSYTAGDTFTIRVDAVTNNSQSSACDSVANSDSCWVQIRTYSDTAWSTGVDSTTVTYTVVDSVSVSATVDPILTFTVSAVTNTNIAGNDSNAGSGTAVTSTVTTLPFGNVTVGTAKLAQQGLQTQTNANNGYFVYGKFITSGNVVMSGDAVTSNNIDKFTASSATWSSPQAFAAPTGTSANVDSAWLGVRTTDTDVTGFNSSNVYGPPDVLSDSGSGKSVMQSTGPDNGSTTTYVTFKIQANAFQPADRYTGTWLYNVVPSY
jgi:hypothetical protein